MEFETLEEVAVEDNVNDNMEIDITDDHTCSTDKQVACRF